MMTKIVDFATSFDIELWNDYQKYILESNDELKDNYINLDPREFVSFPVVIINNKIVCFSALQLNEDRWGKGIGRCSTRMWIHPDYRHGLTKFNGGNKFLNTTYCVPLQLAAAKLNNLDCVFISREYNFLAFAEYAKLIKINCNTDFLLKTNKYNVCGSLDPIPTSCKQWVMIHYLTKNGQEVWSNNMSRYALAYD